MNRIEENGQSLIGLISITNEGYVIKIVEYNGWDKVVIEFQDKYKTRITTRKWLFDNGGIKNPMHPAVWGVGYIGIGEYSGVSHPKEYKVWQSMMERGYRKEFKIKHPTYTLASVKEEWHCFQTFCAWILKQENHDRLLDKKSRYDLDKDIKVKNNLVYSAETCLIVPQKINTLISKNVKRRGSLPIGITQARNKKGELIDKYVAQMDRGRDEFGVRICLHIGYFPTPELAFYAYKEAKESYIKQVAWIEYLKGNITEECCRALHLYEVEITD